MKTKAINKCHNSNKFKIEIFKPHFMSQNSLIFPFLKNFSPKTWLIE